MSGNDCATPVRFDGMSTDYRRRLWIVIGLNGGMFAIETAAGYLGRSQALQADALDFLGDTMTYAISLAVIGASVRTRSMAALAKGASLLIMGLWVFGATAYRVYWNEVPSAPTMGVIGVLALTTNLTSVLILMRYREGDANVRSVWLCSRNDAIGNVAVMMAALGVWLAGAAWPDLIVAAVLATLFIWSAVQIVRQGLKEMRADAGSSATGA